MIYYPLSTLMLSGIKEILLISTPVDLPLFERLLGDGSQWGIQLQYAEQAHPNGLAEAFIIGERFVGNDNCCLILGDNMFYGHDFVKLLVEARTGVEKEGGACVFGYRVRDPERYGVVEFDEHWNALSIEEKPTSPKSKYAVVGLYFYDNNVVQISKSLTPSSRGELEITDVNCKYLEQKALKVQVMGRGFAWLDAGTHSSLLDASNFARTIEERQGFKIACLEEIAFHQSWISRRDLEKRYELLQKSLYGQYLKEILEN